jgi:hypothetical protein
MNEPPGKTESLIGRLRSLPLRAWVVIPVVESILRSPVDYRCTKLSCPSHVPEGCRFADTKSL